MIISFSFSESFLADSDYWFSSSIKFFKLIAAPWQLFSVMVLQVSNSSDGIISLFNVSFIALMNIIMERIFKSKSEKLVSSLEFKCYSTNNGFVGTPAAWDATSGVEEPWTNFFNFKIFLKSALFHMPSDNFNNIIRLISNLNLVETISIPVVSLSDIATIEIVLGIVVMTKVIGWIDKRTSHTRSYIKFI